LPSQVYPVDMEEKGARPARPTPMASWPASPRVASCSPASTRRSTTSAFWTARWKRANERRDKRTLTLVQVALPIGRHAAPWAGRRLIDRMMRRRSQRRPFGELLGAIVIEPVLTGLEALDHRVAALLDVMARVLGGRGITTADVTALRAAPQVKPPTTARKAFDAPLRSRRDRRLNHTPVRHSSIIPRHDRTREAAQPGRRGAKARA
jgi:hypothetical protein